MTEWVRERDGQRETVRETKTQTERFMRLTWREMIIEKGTPPSMCSEICPSPSCRLAMYLHNIIWNMIVAEFNLTLANDQQIRRESL